MNNESSQSNIKDETSFRQLRIKDFTIKGDRACFGKKKIGAEIVTESEAS